MHRYYPMVLLSLTGIALLNPLKVLAYRSRCGLVFSLVGQDRVTLPSSTVLTICQCRLVGAGICSVRWIDTYVGDLCCSLSYSLGVSKAHASHRNIGD